MPAVNPIDAEVDAYQFIEQAEPYAAPSPGRVRLSFTALGAWFRRSSGVAIRLATETDLVGLASASHTHTAADVSSMGFTAYRSTTQTVTAGVVTKCSYDTKTFDTNSWFDLAASRFTPLVAGYYLVNLIVRDGGGGYAIAVLRKNGSDIRYGDGSPSGQVNHLIYMNGSTDYLEAYAYLLTGTTLSGNVYSGFGAMKVG